MPNSDNIITIAPKVSGCSWVAPLGTALPTDAATALNAAFKSHGYITEDGLVQSIQKNVTKFREMGGAVVKIKDDRKDVSFRLTPMEVNEQVLNEWVGEENVSVVSAGKLKAIVNDKPTDDSCYVFEMVADDGGLIRIVVPRGHVTELGDINWRNNAIVGCQLTIEAMADASGNKAYIYFE